MTESFKRIFYPGNYYLADSKNNILVSGKSIEECKRFAYDDDDMLLICIPAHSKPKKKVKPAVEKPSKIILNFDKKELTVEGGSATILGVLYNAGVYSVNIIDSTWVEFVKQMNKCCDTVEIIGIPPINGKEITDEMSNMQ